MIETEFKELIINVKNDILSTRYKIMENTNLELLNLYFRIGKIISENVKYVHKLNESIEICFFSYSLIGDLIEYKRNFKTFKL